MANHMIPFLWLKGEDEETLRNLVRKIHASGIGDVCVESRPHPDFLGDKWWADMDAIIDECEKHGMGIWILDDEKFPTGYAAGRGAGSEHRIEYLEEIHIDVMGPVKGAGILLSCPGPNRRTPEAYELFKVVAAKRIPGKNMDHTTFKDIKGDPVDGETAIDLTPNVVGDVAYWDIPEGMWRVYMFSKTHETGNEKRNKYINPLKKEGTKILIDAIYESHYEKYKDKFGTTIKGFFSDEPQFGGGYGYHAMIGRSPFMSLPWCDELDNKFKPEELISLWYESGEDSNSVRYRYMNEVTRLYGENFCTQIGDWCRAHNVEYMGHVIEENNAHARLGAGTGHYFRALWGQDFAGIDIVLNGLIPGIKGGSHAQCAREFEAEDDFFYYMLANMATSLAHIDEKKKGRTMCEIFGAYGWQEGLLEMKWLADFMLSRGVNTYVPHAFTPKAFPDPDCPPHFYAHGHNPQYRYFGRLMNYMNRMSDIISDGRQAANVGVLYYAEAEWASSNCMKTQEVVKFLTQRQYESRIIPIDWLDNVTADEYKAFIVPTSEYLPAECIEKLSKLSARGVKVYFVDKIPEKLSEGEIDIASALSGCKALPFDEIDKEIYGLRAAFTEKFEPELKVYPYNKGDKKYVLLFNEGIFENLDLALDFEGEYSASLYDAYEDKYLPVKYEKCQKGTRVSLNIPTYTQLVLVLEKGEAKVVPFPNEVKTPVALSDEYAVSISSAEEYPVFKKTEFTKIGNLSCPAGMPGFSGTVRYENAFDAKDETKRFVLSLGSVGETAEVFVNGVSAGVRICPPYDFDITGLVKKGENSLAIEVTNTLVYQQHDSLSMWHPIAPYGLIGPVELKTE